VRRRAAARPPRPPQSSARPRPGSTFLNSRHDDPARPDPRSCPQTPSRPGTHPAGANSRHGHPVSTFFIIKIYDVPIFKGLIRLNLVTAKRDFIFCMLLSILTWKPPSSIFFFNSACSNLSYLYIFAITNHLCITF
jgi:hypothetical protein